jgi:AraC-like DNA-binding protein
MAIVLDMCRMNAGAVLRPVSACLMRKQPADDAVYQRFFGCPVRFGARENSFVIAKKDADRPLSSSNRPLGAVFDKMLTEQLARLDKHDVVARCKAVVLEHLAAGESSADDAAKQLHMSPRSLQRKLAAAEITYLQLVDDARKDLGLRYIEDPQRSLSDIAFELGFSQPSAFTRAFRRWTKVSPTEYRDRHLKTTRS